jgi:hypothetical protein
MLSSNLFDFAHFGIKENNYALLHEPVNLCVTPFNFEKIFLKNKLIVTCVFTLFDKCKM